MKPVIRRFAAPAAILFIVLLLAVLVATAPKHPVAIIRVIDSAGKPIAGATVQPSGMRTKAGPYRSGWYAWRTDQGVPQSPVTTGKDGYAHLPYPKYVFERIETGVICLGVSHPDFVSESPECEVAAAPPSGAPWREHFGYLWALIRHKTLVAKPDPVVLRKGAALRISVKSGMPTSPTAQLFAQISKLTMEDEKFWVRPETGVLFTRRLPAGTHTIRAVQVETNGTAWFSDTTTIKAVIGATNELSFTFKAGVTVRGQLDDAIPRPVINGRVVVHVRPAGTKAEDDPPDWHSWAAVRDDGTFAISSLPEGDTEIVALCAGFVSTNGPGQFKMRYPQKLSLSTNDVTVTIGMETTARLEVKVTDEEDRPLKDVRVVTWPNVRYGEWSATILMSDCYRTADMLLPNHERKPFWDRRVPDFEGTSDTNGIAILPNLPADVTELAADSPTYQLPIVTSSGRGGKSREASCTLVAGQTNHLTLRLEPVGRSMIRHY